jgi:hypothetical protein
MKDGGWKMTLCALQDGEHLAHPKDTPAWEAQVEAPASMKSPLRDDLFAVSRCAFPPKCYP